MFCCPPLETCDPKGSSSSNGKDPSFSSAFQTGDLEEYFRFLGSIVSLVVDPALVEVVGKLWTWALNQPQLPNAQAVLFAHPIPRPLLDMFPQRESC